MLYNGKKLTQIGKGRFTKCYALGVNKVVLVSHDYIKEALSFGWCGNSKLLPTLKRIYYGEIGTIYEATRYRMLTVGKTKAQLTKKHYAMYRRLRRLNNRTLGEAIQCLKDDTVPNRYLIDTLQSLEDGVRNYTEKENIYMDVYSRNCGYTKSGKLKLLDIVFIREEKG